MGVRGKEVPPESWKSKRGGGEGGGEGRGKGEMREKEDTPVSWKDMDFWERFAEDISR